VEIVIVEKIDVVLQARIGSSRLPGKVLMPLNGVPMITRQINRIRKAKSVQNIFVATTSTSQDDQLCDELDKLDIRYYRGAENDVFERYVECIENFGLKESFLRLTADCPMIMPSIIDRVVEVYAKNNVDYVSNTIVPTYPDGTDVEAVRIAAIERLSLTPMSKAEREHVTLGLYRRVKQFSVINVISEEDLSNHRWTVDYPEDYEFVSKIFEHFEGSESSFEMNDVLAILSRNQKLKNGRGKEFRNIMLATEE